MKLGITNLTVVTCLVGLVQGNWIPANESEVIPDVTPLVSLFGAPLDREGRRIEEYRELEGTRMTECYCEVMVNGGHNLRGEEAICGLDNYGKIKCPYNSGCQTARANVQGFLSAVKTCGYDMDHEGCRLQMEKAEFVGTVHVQRCFCRGRLCNEASSLHFELGTIILLQFLQVLSQWAVF